MVCSTRSGRANETDRQPVEVHATESVSSVGPRVLQADFVMRRQTSGVFAWAGSLFLGFVPVADGLVRQAANATMGYVIFESIVSFYCKTSMGLDKWQKFCRDRKSQLNLPRQSIAKVMGTPPLPLDELEYPVILGTSLIETENDGDDGNNDQLNEQHSDNVLASFGYEFLPASVDKSTPGLVSVDDSSGVQVLLSSSTGAAGGVCFKGKLVEHKETDCLLIFDGKGFRLERCLFSCMQLRHVRAHTPRRRVKSQSDQANNSCANAASVATNATSISVASVSKHVKKKPGRTLRRTGGKVNALETTKRPRGRPKGSTKAAIAAKKA